MSAAWRFFTRPRVFDITLVAVLVLIGLTSLVLGIVHAIPFESWAAQSVLAALPLLVRRSRPVAVAAAVTALDAVGLATGIIDSTSLPMAVAFYSVGRYTSGRVTAITTACGAAAYAVVFELTIGDLGAWVNGAIGPLVMVGLGQLVRLRSELRERREQEMADTAVRAERRRIARELHDVVAHHLTVINALVGGARASMAGSPDDAREALRSAEQTSREALAEMRQLLDVLRADGNDAADVTTGVGAAGLPALVEQARTAGLPASLRVSGEPVELPTAIDHAVYRVAQEALTNSRKHSGGARATVRLAYWPAAVEIEVLDDGLAKGPSSTAGFGLGGMAERVALAGGQLQTGPRPEGGFRVHARFPLESK